MLLGSLNQTIMKMWQKFWENLILPLSKSPELGNLFVSLTGQYAPLDRSKLMQILALLNAKT